MKLAEGPVTNFPVMMKFTLSLCAAMLLSACFGEVPHENPLDPGSALFVKTGVVRGQVTTYYQPFLAISGVAIELAPQNLSTVTDGDGSFSFRDVPVGDYWVFARDPRYVPDSVRIAVQQEEPQRLMFKLDALPQIHSFSGQTFHLNNLPPEEDIFYAQFETQVSDPDGLADIASVMIEVPAFGLQDTMQATSSAGVYEFRLFGSELPHGKLHAAIGYPIRIKVRDRLDHMPTPKELILFRIIDSSPQTAAPRDLQTTNARPQLRWQKMNLPFPFTYRARVTRVIGGINTLAWESPNISEQDTTFTVDRTLASGEYRWSVSVIDEFGNTSASQPAAFRVE